MRKLLLGNVTLVALAVGALAISANTAVAAPLPLFNWSGFYVGGNVGGSWGQMSTSVSLADAPFGSSTQRMDGWLGGLQAGYSTQSGIWVFGFETDFQLTSQNSTAIFAGRTADIPAIPEIPAIPGTPGTPGTPAILCERIEGVCVRGTIDIPAVPGTPAIPGFPGVPGVPAIPGVTGVANYRQELPWFGTFRARLGVTVMPTWLLYVTGGLVVGEITTNASFTIPTATVATRFSNIKAGWVAGAGTAWALSPNWSFKIEYLYIDFGYINNSFPSIAPFVGTFTGNSHVTDNIVRIGLSYRFGGPVVTN